MTNQEVREQIEAKKSAQEYCAECNHIEMCRWYPYEGCEFRDLPKPERKTGRWTIEDVHSATYKYRCSECKAHHRARYDFCPTCGAKMGGES